VIGLVGDRRGRMAARGEREHEREDRMANTLPRGVAECLSVPIEWIS